MHYQGHVGCALLASAPLALVTVAMGYELMAFFAGVFAVSLSTLPDVDQYVHSLRHRGFTHTVWFVVGVSLALGIFGGVIGPPAVGVSRPLLGGFLFVVGASSLGSHLLADVVTPMGLRPFSPVWPTHYSLDYIASANPGFNLRLLVLGIIGFGAAVLLGYVLSPMP